ncbi:paraquat-inducible protein A [Arcobacter arenosus]|uniref:Paraquat-inducible protein A n=1 Tax=Arcobacter arenosus TaxID=2576037 RepID=A0A5R8Y0A4_9BACT|nr:paraquat-inducible protein A [Arcobacter arenosus]TLP37640.1 paraquat-inducible protein A [Arcobacter arenosus]
MTKNLISSFILTAVFISLLFLAFNSYKNAKIYENTYKQYAQEQTIKNSVEKNTQEMLNGLIGALLGQNPKVTKDEIPSKKLQLENLKEKPIEYVIIFATIITLSLLSFFVVSKKIFLTYLHSVTILSLVFGLISPIFMMYILLDYNFQNIVNIKDAILQFESLTIIESINKLIYVQEKYFVGIIILLFSVVFPFIKTLLSFVNVFINHVSIVNKTTKLLSALSKWSMTDVFVLSIFLVYLSSVNSGMSKIVTQIEVGFYFFFIYVILSIILSFFNKIKIQ